MKSNLLLSDLKYLSKENKKYIKPLLVGIVSSLFFICILFLIGNYPKWTIEHAAANYYTNEGVYVSHFSDSSTVETSIAVKNTLEELKQEGKIDSYDSIITYKTKVRIGKYHYDAYVGFYRDKEHLSKHFNFKYSETDYSNAIVSQSFLNEIGRRSLMFEEQISLVNPTVFTPVMNTYYTNLYTTNLNTFSSPISIDVLMPINKFDQEVNSAGFVESVTYNYAIETQNTIEVYNLLTIMESFNSKHATVETYSTYIKKAVSNAADTSTLSKYMSYCFLVIVGFAYAFSIFFILQQIRESFTTRILIGANRTYVRKLKTTLLDLLSSIFILPVFLLLTVIIVIVFNALYQQLILLCLLKSIGIILLLLTGCWITMILINHILAFINVKKLRVNVKKLIICITFMLISTATLAITQENLHYFDSFRETFKYSDEDLIYTRIHSSIIITRNLESDDSLYCLDISYLENLERFNYNIVCNNTKFLTSGIPLVNITYSLVSKINLLQDRNSLIYTTDEALAKEKGYSYIEVIHPKKYFDITKETTSLTITINPNVVEDSYNKVYDDSSIYDTSLIVISPKTQELLQLYDKYKINYYTGGWKENLPDGEKDFLVILQATAIIPLIFSIFLVYSLFKLIVPEQAKENRIRRMIGIKRTRLFFTNLVDGIFMFILPFLLSFLIAQAYSQLVFSTLFELESFSILAIILSIIVICITIQATRSTFKNKLSING